MWGFAGLNGLPRRTHYTDWTNGAPRIGFAYRINDKTAIRGGFGVYYQSDTSNNNCQTGFSQTTSYQSYFHGKRIIPLGLRQPARARQQLR